MVMMISTSRERVGLTHTCILPAMRARRASRGSAINISNQAREVSSKCMRPHRALIKQVKLFPGGGFIAADPPPDYRCTGGKWEITHMYAKAILYQTLLMTDAARLYSTASPSYPAFTGTRHVVLCPLGLSSNKTLRLKRSTTHGGCRCVAHGMDRCNLSGYISRKSRGVSPYIKR